MFVNGSYRIGLYSIDKISIGDEICFDYGDSYFCEWIKPFNKKTQEEYRKLKLEKKKK